MKSASKVVSKSDPEFTSQHLGTIEVPVEIQLPGRLLRRLLQKRNILQRVNSKKVEFSLPMMYWQIS